MWNFWLQRFFCGAQGCCVVLSRSCMSVCALNQAPVPVQEALLQVSGARWAADEMLAVAELSSSSADGLWYMTHAPCVCVSDERFWNFPYSNLFFFSFFSCSLFYWSVNSNGLWWRRFLFSLKCFHGKILERNNPDCFYKKKKSTFKSSPLKCGFCYKARVVMVICNDLFVVGWFAEMEL